MRNSIQLLHHLFKKGKIVATFIKANVAAMKGLHNAFLHQLGWKLIFGALALVTRQTKVNNI